MEGGESVMSYIIDRASLMKTGGIQKASLLINNNRIEFMRNTMDNIHFMRMDMSSYLLTPGYVMIDFSLHTRLHFKEFKKYIIEHYLKKGCTSLLTVANVKNEHELVEMVKQRRQLMINSPIDYYVGIKLPFKSLTPSILRKCKQQNIAVVIVEFDNDDNLRAKSWAWIRDAMFSNPITFIPFLNEKKNQSIKSQKLIQVWEQLMKEHRLPSLSEVPEEGKPLSKNVLMKLGIYPEKGDIRVGGQVNYNLYKLNEIRYYTDGNPNMNHANNPTITVHQGKIVNANGIISFVPGVGEECFIPISGRFMPQSVSI